MQHNQDQSQNNTDERDTDAYEVVQFQQEGREVIPVKETAPDTHFCFAGKESSVGVPATEDLQLSVNFGRPVYKDIFSEVTSL